MAGRKPIGPNGQRIVYDRVSLALSHNDAEYLRASAKRANMSLNRYIISCTILDVNCLSDEQLKRVIDAANSIGVAPHKMVAAASLQFADAVQEKRDFSTKYMIEEA